ncbi:hypothetical protein O6H91_18G053100 [Diphasiastrum complanatum]|uniref:Uncharacterized protein n=1 Tax=Diphasiastrum complanatum TaxID=34168 RepID=A0ACC2B186_DIPCM|nr:hypothetical protein O6H91_18G053100 [Diphasiastrum complanatum]
MQVFNIDDAASVCELGLPLLTIKPLSVPTLQPSAILLLLLRCPLYWISCLLLSLQPRVAQSQWTPRDALFINCGSFQNMTINGQHFLSDEGTYVSGGVAVSISHNQSTNGLSEEYLTARIFTTSTSYHVPIMTGMHWIRLYFYPFDSGIFNIHSSVFSVTVEEYLMLGNLNVVAEINDDIGSDTSFILKEYCVNATRNFVSIIFTPSKPNETFAFINVIEIVPVPDKAYQLDNPIFVSDHKKIERELGVTTNALQTMYRLNVAGPSVEQAEDSGQLRRWATDNAFIRGSVLGMIVRGNITAISYSRQVPEYIAPRPVYSNARIVDNSNSNHMTWIFPVDIGYSYLVRLHLCELIFHEAQQRMFNVYLNNLTAYLGLDILAFVRKDSPYFLDFVIRVLEEPSVLWVQVGRSTSSIATKFEGGGILNGLEILKFNDSAGSLVSTSLTRHYSTSSGSESHKRVLGFMIGTLVVGPIALGTVVAGICFCRRMMQKKAAKFSCLKWQHVRLVTGFGGNMTPSRINTLTASLGGSFPFQKVLDATNNFHESLVIGTGGFGMVYKGLIDGVEVAVKRANPHSQQGLTEFKTEIELFSTLRHRHLVSLIGYCNEQQEMILLYEFMANGCLKNHLYGSDFPSLSWKQRLQICIDSAKGLHYLHTGAGLGIIHRDVKTSNILLDEKFVAKVSDFGLSKMRATPDHTHVSTAVKGSFGYLDPQYYRTQQLTDKSDVYSFGVVLLEVMCGRAPVDPCLPREQVNICDWALHWQKQGLLHHTMDPRLVGDYSLESLQVVGQIAEACLAEKAINRPSIGDVLWRLECALQQHEAAAIKISSCGRNVHRAEQPATAGAASSDNVITNQELDDQTGDSDDTSVSSLFSQMLNSQRG